MVDCLFDSIATFAASSIIALWPTSAMRSGSGYLGIQKYGASFLADTQREAESHFGALPQIWGTLYSSLLALLIGGFVGVTIAVFLT